MADELTSRGDPRAGERLFELYDRMIGDVEMPSVLREVADVVCQDLAAERATVYLIDTETDELMSAAVVGNVVRTIRVPISPASLAGYCAMSGRAFVVPDAYGDLTPIDAKLRFDSSWDALNDFRTRDVMCAPAMFKGRVLGVVQVVNSQGAPFGQAHLPVLAGVSRLIGYSLYHARLYDDLATLKQLEKQKAEFMRIMVHELKAPIAVAKMMSDAALEGDLVAGEGAAMVSQIGVRMMQMLGLVEDMLELAKVKSGDPMGAIEVLDLAATVREACEDYRGQAEGKGLALAVETPDSAVPVRFDTRGLSMVLSNLVSNAVKYTAAGAVAVRLTRQGPRAVLAVSDTGIGIPEKEIGKLFTEFFRASNARRQRIPGSGVGLAGVKCLVERFGGDMTLRTTEGEGSTFTVRLPVARDASHVPVAVSR